MANQPGTYSQSFPRPMWQLLLAEQAKSRSELTCAENRALPDFLIELVIEGCNLNRIKRRIAHCLVQTRECDQTG